MFKKILIYTGSAIFLLLVLGSSLSYFYQDQIVQKFVSEVNKSIKTPIKAQRIGLSLWEKFPQLSIKLHQVWIQESLAQSTDTLAVANNIYCTFGLWDIINGNFVIDQVHLEDAEVHLLVTEEGINNFTIIQRDTSKVKKEVAFKIEQIDLSNVAINYLDRQRNQDFQLLAHDVAAGLEIQNDLYRISLVGEITSEKIEIDDQQYFKDKPLNIDGRFDYHYNQRLVSIYPSVIGLNQSSFLVEGDYQSRPIGILDLKVNGDNTDIQTVLSLFSEDTYKKYSVYRSEGDLYFEGSLKGQLDDTHSPALDLKFGCKQASFYHPNYKKGVQKVDLTGHYFNPSIKDLSTAELTLDKVSGVLDGKPFKGSLILQNFNDYQINCDFEAILNVNSLLQFYPIESLRSASGMLDLDIHMEGILNSTSKKTSQNFVATGEINLEELNFELEQNNLPFRNFNGNFLFNRRDLAISGFTGSIGNSDFVLNGFFKNIISYLFTDNQPLSIEADLKSIKLDFDELLTGNVVAENEMIEGEQQYANFNISPRLKLDFNCKIDQLKFRRFRGQGLNGQLLVNNQIAQGKNISVNAIGGKMKLDGTVDSRKPDQLLVKTRSSYDHIHIDSLFYIFENFDQEFLVDRHLKGQVFSEIDMTMVFDRRLRFKSEDLLVDAGVIIENGELNDFEPMQRLSTFVDRMSLSRLRFADLKNDIHIEDKVIYLPNMTVESNVSAINVNGTHTLDQDINYRLKVPLKGANKDKDEYFGAIEDDGLNTNLFLKIVGNTKDYKIVYDKTAVSSKIKSDIRQEGRELREAINNQGKVKTDQELSDEEYFDFGEDTDSLTVIN